MKKNFLFILLALAPMLGLIMTSCSKDSDDDTIPNCEKEGTEPYKEVTVTANPTEDGLYFDGVIYYQKTSNIDPLEVSAIKLTKEATNIRIPDNVNIDGKIYKCTVIEKEFGQKSSNLLSVVLPQTLKSIKDNAFSYCSNLNSINIPSNVTSIASNAFYNSALLISVKLYISDNATFCTNRYCNLFRLAKVILLDKEGREIKDFIIPQGFNSIGVGTFRGCSGLTSVTIPNSVKSIQAGSFDGCSGLTSITIPNSVTSIRYEAFFQCGSLTSITVPNSVTSIEDKAFHQCSKLTSIVVESGNTKYDSRNNCNAIIETSSNTLIVGCVNSFIPNSVTSIGVGAFQSCSGLTSITIPNSVTSIGESAFEFCSGLTSITIPNSVKVIDQYAFRSCNKLTTIVVESGNKKYDSRDNCNAIIETSSNTLIAGCNNSVIPNSVTRIGADAFSGYKGLTSVTIPNSVTIIGYGAFWNCVGLTSVTIPNSVKSIGESAFYHCSGLTSVTIGSGTKTIGTSAFASCPDLTDVYCLAESVPTTVASPFDQSTINNATLHAPAASLEAYMTTAPWSGFGTILALTNEEIKTLRIENVNNHHVQPPVLFDLQGRQYSTPTKGFYIKDGKKYLKK